MVHTKNRIRDLEDGVLRDLQKKLDAHLFLHQLDIARCARAIQISSVVILELYAGIGSQASSRREFDDLQRQYGFCEPRWKGDLSKKAINDALRRGYSQN